jgi:predicted metal-binding membrane protein
MTGHAVAPNVESRLSSGALVAGVLAVAAAGWLVLVPRMAGMDTGPGGDPGALGWFTVTWAIMTVAMMFPASAPAALAPANAWRRNAPAGAAIFLVGYVAAWMLAGLIGYSLVVAVRGLHPSALGWSSSGRYVAGAAIAAAGLYQLTRTKRRWLERCRSHEDRGRGRGGFRGALLAGVEHGGCCVACCWTLMVALYALGMMSIAWMAVLTVLIAAERLLPRPAPAAYAVAAVLVALGVAVASAPAAVPALTVPSHAHAMTIGGDDRP